jgi:hypothetical protein
VNREEESELGLEAIWKTKLNLFVDVLALVSTKKFRSCVDRAS